MNDEQIRQAVQMAFDSVRTEQPPLDFHIVHERSTAHRLAVYLEQPFHRWNVDCEYDRYGQVQKMMEGIRVPDPRRILPDIIVHHRGQNGPGHNLLVIELKKNDARDDFDFEKLRRLTDMNLSFCYQLGLYINLNQGRFDCTWFKNGAVTE